MAARRLLIVTGDFPVASETFIVAHVRGMLERGWTVAVAAGTIDAARVTELFGDKAPQTFALEAAGRFAGAWAGCGGGAGQGAG